MNKKKKEVILGIDEAGRGSLIGPMIIAGVAIRKSEEKFLKRKGVKDSKKLSPTRREELEKIIKEKALWWKTIRVTPRSIDNENLNKLTLKKMRLLALEALREKTGINIIIVDQVGKKKKKLVREASGIKQVMEEKADEKYIAVGAASIIAKTERDRIIKDYHDKYGVEGSGYPSDPNTIKWLIKNWEKIPRKIIRDKWKTLKKLGLNRNSLKLDDYFEKKQRDN